MKKLACLCLVLSLLVLCGGCSPDAQPGAKESGIDLDLSIASGTVVYAQVSAMMTNAKHFLGKTIRIAGWFDYYVNPETGAVLTSCVIPDATACCQQGIEFVWSGEHTYPDDYPVFGTEVTVTGRLESYEEGTSSYLHLVDTEVVWGRREMSALP